MAVERGASFGEQLRRYRLRAGLSQEALAERARLAASAISALERGMRRHPHPRTLQALADALRLSEAERRDLAALARGPGSPTPDEEVVAPSPALPARTAPAANLPAPLTSFVGRERELAGAATLVQAGVRLVTLTGPGGAGKTRLAFEGARAVQHHFPDGVWFVDLTALTDPRLVPQTLATALGILETGGRSFTERIVSALDGRRTLVVLDNCEHLVDACAKLVTTLLRSCAGLTIVATSHESLAVAGEQVYPVPPLPLPPADLLAATTADAAALSTYPAIQLFVERAMAVQPRFALTDANATAVAQICSRLDGMPLAIELAAARVRVLAPEQIAARLDDRFRLLSGGDRLAPTRHQTLHDLLDWSHDLLTEPERVLFRRLSVFARGWTLEAAEAIGAGDGISAEDVLDLLMALVDKSLVVMEDQGETARYRLLESIREYATARLVEAGEAARVRLRHRDWYWALAEQAASGPVGRRQARWMPRLAEEHDNLRAAIEWSLTEGKDPASGLAIVYALRAFWVFRYLLREGVAWYTRALAATGTAAPALRAKALQQMAIAAWLMQDPATGLPAARQALDLAREINHGWATVRALRALALHTHLTGDSATAISLLEEALAQARLLEDRQLLPHVLHSLGILTLRRGNVAEARGRFLEALQIARTEGMDEQTSYALVLLGYCALLQGEAAESAARYAEGLVIAREMDHPSLTSDCLGGLALTAALEDRFERAARLLGAWDALCERHGIVKPPRELALVERERERLRVAMGDRAFAGALAAGRALPLQDALREALDDAELELRAATGSR